MTDPSPAADGAGARLLGDAFVLDLHVHPPDFVPQPYRSLWHAVTPRRPPDQPLDSLSAAGVDAAVVKAVGDPIVTRWYRGRSPAAAVLEQLTRIEAAATAGGARIVRTTADLDDACRAGVPAVLLGVEGGDAIADDVDAVDGWYERGVRAIVLVHLRDNQLGRTCLPWQQYAGPVPVRRRAAAGLSRLGAAMVTRMNRLGMLVDLAHADRATLLGAVDVAAAPVVSSHTGARALQDFPRYLADDELRAIAGTGGVVGLWPYRSGRRGVRSIGDLVAHARHIADVIGAEHLAIGTDMNGVPGTMSGFRGEGDLPWVAGALLAGGFTTGEVSGIVGGNALRVLRAVEAAASP